MNNKDCLRKSVALIIIIILILIPMFMSPLEHNCAGEGCLVCQCAAGFRRLWQSFFGLSFLTFYLYIYSAIFRRPTKADNKKLCVTLVALKVKMNN